MLTRRNLLAASALAAGGSALAGCSNILGTGIGISVSSGTVSISLPQSVITFIQNAVNVAQQYIPTAESILQEAASLFPNQTISEVITVGSDAINTVISALEQLVAPAPTTPVTTTASAELNRHLVRRMGAKLRATSTFTASLIGTTAQGVAIYGVRAQ